ncbi:hypothetical protein HQ584_02710 [Patescibacteria group bacterium]|nr:hypothetical protein [Patescibacteria group bacterium]
MKKRIETVFTHKMEGGAEGRLGIDDNGKLYWNEQAVITEQKVTLQRWVNIALIIASISTLAIAIFTGLQFFGYEK